MKDIERVKDLFTKYTDAMVEKGFDCENVLCGFRRNEAVNSLEMSTADRMKIDAMGLKEFNLKKLNGKPINENKNAAWELILGAYCIVLEEDPKWHFFYEDSYNIIRCSAEFEDALAEYLDECGVEYSSPQVWVDGQTSTFKYQHVFSPMFHTFSMMAVIAEYDPDTIENIFDRVYHCFLNHQFLYLCYKYDQDNLHYLWESKILSNAAISRACFTGHLSSNISHRDAKKKEYKERWWAEKCLAGIRKWIRKKRNTSPA